ncbi:MAG: beta strand repeat-containing protein, partial [Pseudohongiellaceae bacterium]
ATYPTGQAVTAFGVRKNEVVVGAGVTEIDVTFADPDLVRCDILREDGTVSSPNTGICTLHSTNFPGLGTWNISATQQVGTKTLSSADELTITISNNPPVPSGDPRITIADADSVPEGSDATFTLTAAPAPAADLTVTLTAAATTGSFLGASPPTMAVFTASASTATVAIPTIAAGDGVTGVDGVITVTLTDGDGYDVPSDGTEVATVTVQDVPTITIDWNSKARPSAMPNSAECPYGRIFPGIGVCEGDTIVYTITATPTPAADTIVRIGRASAGGGFNDLGLTNPYSYHESAPNDPSPEIEETIPAGTSSITYERVMRNLYGAENDGGYLIEAICRDTSNNSNNANCPDATGGKLSIQGRAYYFTDTPSTVGADDNDDSESFVNVRSYRELTLSVAADEVSVTAGEMISFTISGASPPNFYDANGLAPLPLTIGATQDGTAVPNLPTVSMAVGATAATVTVTTGMATGDLVLTLTTGVGYGASSTNASATATVEAAPAESATPGIVLADASNGGSKDDNITTDGTPTFNLGGLVSGAEVVILASREDLGVARRRVTITATGATSSVTFNNDPADGGCERSSDSGKNYVSGNVCALSSDTPTEQEDGVWTITATQTESGRSPSTATLEIEIYILAPVATLVAAEDSIEFGATTTITVTLTEVAATDLMTSDIGFSGSGTLGTLTKVSGLVYTIPYTAGANVSTATISIAGNVFTDADSNANIASAPVVIATAGGVAASSTPVVDLAAISDSSNTNAIYGVIGTDSDDITSDQTPTITVTDVASGATVLVTASHDTETDVTVEGMVGGALETIDLTLGTLAEGVWTIVATHTDGSKTAADSTGLPITIDITAPTVTITEPANNDPAMSKIYSAVDNDDGTTVMKWRGNADTTCSHTLTSGTADYTEGDDLPLTDEANNGRYSCFFSTDLAGNIGSAVSGVIGGIDVTPPTITITPDPATVIAGESIDITITSSETAVGLAPADVSFDTGTFSTPEAPTDTALTVRYTAPATPGTATLTIAADAFTDAAGNGNPAATHSITINAATIDNPTLSVTGDGDVAEGSDASFTISAAEGTPTNDLTVAITAANATGTFLGTGAPTSVTLTNNASSWTVTVPTEATLGTGTGGTIMDGTITLALGTSSGYMVTSDADAATGTVTVKDIPVISADYASLSNGGKTCPATGETGVCEGDAIVFTLTADAAPATDLDVRIGRLSAGANSCCDYGITNPHNYVLGAEDDGHRTVTITGGQNSGTHTINTENGFGDNGDGGYFIEVVCLDGDQTSCLSDGTINSYTFVVLSKGSDPTNAGGDNVNNCSPAGGSNGDDPSECFAPIHPVTASAMSVAAVADAVNQTSDAVFTITASSVPNIYNADRTALAGLPISITVGDSGMSLMGTAPTMATIAAGGTTVPVTLPTQEGDAGAGHVSLTLDASTDTPPRYSVGAPSAATVSVDEPMAGLPVISIANAADVAEGGDATFTVTSSVMVDADLTVRLAVTNSAGLFLGASPPDTVTIAVSGTSAEVTIPTVAFRHSDGNIADGTITVTLGGSTDYTGTGTGTVTVKDIPVITVDYAGQTSGNKLCPAAKVADKAGVCEGDAIVYTLTADAISSGALAVNIGRLSTDVITDGAGDRLNYGIADAHNYAADSDFERDGVTVMLPGGQASADYVVNTANAYGAENEGAYYIEVTCHGSTSVSPCSPAQADSPYTLVQTGKGQGKGNGTAANPRTSNCDVFPASGRDGDDSSECLVLIHSVAAPGMSVAAAAASVEEGGNAVFNITATAAPNHYNDDRTMRIALPIGFTVAQTGDSVATDPLPETADLPANGAAIAVTLLTQAGDPGEGDVSLMLNAGTGYSVTTTNAITVTVTEPPPAASA